MMTGCGYCGIDLATDQGFECVDTRQHEQAHCGAHVYGCGTCRAYYFDEPAWTTAFRENA